MRDEVRELYLSGRSISEITKMTGVPAGRIRKWCHDILRPYGLAVRLASGSAMNVLGRG